MRKRSWTLPQLVEAVRSSTSFRQVLAKLGLRPAGGNYANLHAYLSEHGISVGHFSGKAWNRGLTGCGKPRRKLEDILCSNSAYGSSKLKRRLFAAGLKPQRCEECGWAQRSPDGRLPLELDHLNGNARDNRLENLRILCPNCHSLTPTYRGRNVRKRARVVE